eukprot:8429075-Lingulodinium_polyedra.AAC.1
MHAGSLACQVINDGLGPTRAGTMNGKEPPSTEWPSSETASFGGGGGGRGGGMPGRAGGARRDGSPQWPANAGRDGPPA